MIEFGKKKAKELFSFLLAFSTLIFAYRAKIGALVILLCIGLLLYCIFKWKNNLTYSSMLNQLWILFFFLAILGLTIRAFKIQWYITIGYCLAVILIYNFKVLDRFTFFLWLERIGILQVVGVLFQSILPSIYFKFISLFYNYSTYEQIYRRYENGYLVGFTREVSYTMFLIIMALAINYFKCYRQSKNKRAFKILGCFLALIISGKRATLVFGILSFFIIYAIRYFSKINWKRMIFLFLTILIIIFITVPLWENIPGLGRFASIFSGLKNGDLGMLTNGRSVIYLDAIKLWTRNPILGIGWGNFKFLVSPTVWYYGFDVHNCFLQVLTETGILGFLLYLFLVITVLWDVKQLLSFNEKRVDSFRLLYSYILLFFLLYSITEPILYEYTDYIIFIIAVCSVNVILHNENNKLIHKLIKVLNIQR